ncbi:hypothetical protein PM082_020724 [Marasmius tenuissimus]|nr:hypothetical protein PM082_020724 [Marasmius tenuissimus]
MKNISEIGGGFRIGPGTSVTSDSHRLGDSDKGSRTSRSSPSSILTFHRCK